MEKHVGCINVRPIIQYMEMNAPNRISEFYSDLGLELEGIHDPKSFLTDLNNWVSSSLFLKLIKRARKIIHDDDLAFKIGLHSIENRDLGYIQNILILAFGTPFKAIKHSQVINDHFNKTKTIDIISLTRNSCTIRLRWFKDIPLSDDFCSLNKGIYSAIPGIWGLPYAELKEEKCFFQGDEYCEYHLRWKNRRIFVNVLRQIFLPWSIIKVSTAELERDKLALKEKYDQVHQLNHKLYKRIEQLETLQESSNAILSSMKMDELLDLVLTKLLRVANLDRAAIFLLNKKKDLLVPVHAVGVDEATFAELKDYCIPISKNDNIIARSVKEEKPIVIREVKNAALNPKNILLQKFNPKAFVLVPLSVKGKVIGIMVGDNSQSKEELAEIDANFLTSFANHIAMTLENASLYKKIEESEKKYRQIVESANEGIIIIKPDGVISFSNQYFKNLIGHDSVENLKVVDFVMDEDKEKFQSMLHSSEAYQPTKNEVVLKGKDGSISYVQLSNVPIVSDDEFKGTLSMVADLTEKKQLENRLLQSQKLESIGTMAGGIAHDFNNLLTGILGFTDLLKDETNDTPKTRSYFNIIDNSGEKAISLIKKILDFSSGRKQEGAQNAVLQEVVHDTVMLFESSVKKKIDSKIIIPQDLKPISCDSSQLQQVILNLFINAGDVLEDGGIITVSAEPIGAEKLKQRYGEALINHEEYAHITFSDNGPGMKQEVLERIFDPFFTTKEIGKGTGLGLSVVYGIVNSSEGIIDVESQEGKGSSFHLYLPFAIKITQQKNDSHDESEVFSGNETILFIDDKKMIRELVKRILTNMGYTVLLAESGLEAIDIYKEKYQGIDLVMLDVQMPGLNGVQTAEIMKEINPTMKIILCSGQKDFTFDESFQSDRFISKPFRINPMLKSIREVLDNQNEN